MQLMNRPDFSNYLVHFSSEGALKGNDDDNPVADVVPMTAQERLISILRDKKIRASSMPWTGAHAVCFTECPWSSLLAHTEVYSPYGVGFSKKSIFAKHGGPAIYIRPDLYKKQEEHGYASHLKSFLTPFAPAYRPQHMKRATYDIGTCDYAHEREWRVPHDFPFEYEFIEFVILNNYHDMAAFPQDLKDAIGQEKFILMDNYRLIEKLWPVHII